MPLPEVLTAEPGLTAAGLWPAQTPLRACPVGTEPHQAGVAVGWAAQQDGAAFCHWKVLLVMVVARAAITASEHVEQELRAGQHCAT